MSSRVPALRCSAQGDLRSDGRWVLYWMTAARRTRANHALDRAIELARELDRPLVVLEALRCDYPWASPRFHRFILDGMADNAKALTAAGVTYYPFVESLPGEGQGLLERLSEDACAVVTDHSPAFFLPAMLEAARRRVTVRFEAVDSVGLLPLRCSDRAMFRAFDFRRLMQRELPGQLAQTALREPLRRVALRPLAAIPEDISRRWPATPLADGELDLAVLPLDHTVTPVKETGGSRAGRAALRRFARHVLPHYGERRNHPDHESTSGLSAYLHFGHLSAQEIFDEVTAADDWTPEKLSPHPKGAREGWWGVSPSAEAYMDQLLTWRELGQHFCFHRPDHAEYASLPQWARTSLGEHAADPRPHLYSRERFEQADTHDPLWNAAQRQLRETGVIHNAVRMLWGKKILHWSASPEEAWETLFALNDRWALDGRDPNSSSGIGWTLGRFDRAWGPERPVFGKVRYMTSDSARRKWRLKAWLERWSEA